MSRVIIVDADDSMMVARVVEIPFQGCGDRYGNDQLLLLGQSTLQDHLHPGRLDPSRGRLASALRTLRPA